MFFFVRLRCIRITRKGVPHTAHLKGLFITIGIYMNYHVQLNTLSYVYIQYAGCGIYYVYKIHSFRGCFVYM